MKLKVLLLSLVSIQVSAQYNTSVGILDDSDESMSVRTEFSTRNFQFKHDNIYYPVTTKKGVSYFVYVDADFRPVVGEIRNGIVTTEFLDKEDNPIYRITNDAHNLFGLGIDKYGYIHITGDMHNYSRSFPSSNYPDRYFGQNNMYWISAEPYNISEFHFRGGEASTALPGEGFSYVSFITDRNGELYARYRMKSGVVRHEPGEIAWALARYNAEMKTWHLLGEKIDSATYFPNDPGPFFNVIFWSPIGTGQGSWYQGFMGDITFDFNNRMHLIAAVNVDNQVENRYLMYAYSDDGGKTFFRADDTPVDLPIHNKDNHWGDTLFGQGSFNAQPSIGHDKEGVPLINFENYANRFFRGWTYYDTLNNKWSDPQDALIWFARIRTNTDANGTISFPGGGNYVATRMFGIDTQNNGQDVYHWRASSYSGELFGHDYRSNMEQNVFRSFYTNNRPELQILRFKFEPLIYDPLPEYINTLQLGASEGEAGTFHDVFQLRSSGSGFTENDFNGQFSYIYGEGDFSLKCRVIQMDYHTDETFAGLMVSSTEDASENMIATTITWNGIQNWIRNASGLEKTYQGNYNEPSEWLRIDRVGDTIIIFHGNNGEEWFEVERKANFISDRVYVGLISGSGLDTVGHSRVDNISLSINEIVEIPQDILNSSASNKLSFRVFPNPVSDRIHILSSEKAKISRAAIFNSLGQKVMDLELHGNGEIPVQGLEPGIYILSLQFDDNQVLFKRIIKE